MLTFVMNLKTKLVIFIMMALIWPGICLIFYNYLDHVIVKYHQHPRHRDEDHPLHQQVHRHHQHSLVASGSLIVIWFGLHQSARLPQLINHCLGRLRFNQVIHLHQRK